MRMSQPGRLAKSATLRGPQRKGKDAPLRASRSRPATTWLSTVRMSP